MVQSLDLKSTKFREGEFEHGKHCPAGRAKILEDLMLLMNLKECSMVEAFCLLFFANMFPIIQCIDVNCLIILILLAHRLLKTIQVSAQLLMD